MSRGEHHPYDIIKHIYLFLWKKNICIHIKNGINNFYLKTKIDKSNSITSLIIEDKEYKCNKNHKFKITLSISLLEKFFLEFSTSIIKWFN